jgi:hypothetical protein
MVLLSSRSSYQSASLQFWQGSPPPPPVISPRLDAEDTEETPPVQGAKGGEEEGIQPIHHSKMPAVGGGEGGRGAAGQGRDRRSAALTALVCRSINPG